MTAASNARLIGGVVGPAAFITAWALLGRRVDGYSPVEDPISRLAAAGAPTRAAMTAGFLAYGVGVVAFAWEHRRERPGPAWMALAASGVSTAAVAAFPLDSHDTLHAVAVAPAYVSLAAAPLLARRGPASVAAGVVTGVALALSVAASPTGLFQRIGLTTGDAWIMATAVGILSSRRRGRACSG